jgi:hypothetical protein
LEIVMVLSRVLLAAAVVTGITHGARAQGPPPPQPGPEHKRLEFLVGRWKLNVVEKASPLDPSGGKITGTTDCEWFDGRFQVICRSELTTGGQAVKHLEVFAYNANERGYTRYFISSEGYAAVSPGKVSGKTWSWGPIVNTVDGKAMNINATITEVSPDSLTSTITVATDGGAAQILSEGTLTRLK